eukprot:800225-Pelagomonas_calceolata.AAC.1
MHCRPPPPLRGLVIGQTGGTPAKYHVLCLSGRRPATSSARKRRQQAQQPRGGHKAAGDEEDEGEGMPGFDSLMGDKAYTQ